MVIPFILCLFLLDQLPLFYANAWTIVPFETMRLQTSGLGSRVRLSRSSSSTGTSESEADLKIFPTRGSVVTIECRLKPEGSFVPEPLIDGVILHDEEPPAELHFVLNEGNFLPGLHDLVASLSIGESVTDVSLDAGWGAHNPDLVAKISFDQSGLDPGQIRPGVELAMANGVRCAVTEVSEEDFTIDANPPLAGASYLASVKLLAFEDGPEITEFCMQQEETSSDNMNRYRVATFALGCFWGGELEYMREPGVVGTSVGYTQGEVDNPSYEQVCSGATGHTEAIIVKYDSTRVSYERLVHLAMDKLGESKYFLNRVGNDKGTQYRHGIYYHNLQQKSVAEEILSHYGQDCVTECLPATKFYFAEQYHQQYLLKGGQSARKGDPSVIRCYG